MLECVDEVLDAGMDDLLYYGLHAEGWLSTITLDTRVEEPMGNPIERAVLG